MSNDTLFAGYDDAFVGAMQHDRELLPSLILQASARLESATTSQLVAELRAPSTTMVFVRDQAVREALARILKNTDL